MISVIVPVYNGEKYLEESLTSICNSSYLDLEIVVIDDGSEDNSPVICKKLAEKDDRIKYYSKKNGGIVSARNEGILKAKGDYLCFCDQDDLVDEQMYEKLLDSIEKNHADICICSTCRLTDGIIKTEYEKLDNNIYVEDSIINKLLLPLLFIEYHTPYNNDRIRMYGTIWKFLIKSEFIYDNKIEFRRFVNFEDDWILVIEMLCLANKVCTIKEGLYYWRVNTSSESYNWKYIDNIDVKLKDLDDFIENKLLNAGIKLDIVHEYRRAKVCINTVKIFENEASPQNSKSWKNKYLYLREYLNAIYVKESLKCNIPLKKGYLRYNLLLFFIRYKCIWLGYIFNKILKLAAVYSMKKSWGVQLEKKLKKV